MIESLTCGTHGIDDELVDFALLLRLHPLVGIVGAVRTVAARDYARDLAGNIGHIKCVDLFGAALTLEKPRPRWFNTAAKRRYHAQSGDDDTSHGRLRANLFAHAVKLTQTA